MPGPSARNNHVHTLQPSLSAVTQISVASSSSTSSASQLMPLDSSTSLSSFGDVSPVLNSPELLTMAPSLKIRDLRTMELHKESTRLRSGVEDQVLEEGENPLLGILLNKTNRVVFEERRMRR